MLVWPHQMYLTGITAGVILMVASGWFNIWSMWILVIFYMERKNKMVRMRCASACMCLVNVATILQHSRATSSRMPRSVHATDGDD